MQNYYTQKTSKVAHASNCAMGHDVTITPVSNWLRTFANLDLAVS